ncbi:MAG: response regulator transcription factor [Deltaproteobacteria bacterium]|nr:response regulator transcription factor [Deltaproteobacteria bacterium]
MRVLIAEDDLTSRTVLHAVLEKLGHEVTATVNGADALSVMEKPDPPSLIILDWMMPVMDGLEVVRRVRAMRSSHSPYMILLTTKGEKGDIIAGLDAGADDYLSKPFDSGELRARVDVGRRMIEMQDRLEAKVKELQKALDEIKTLQGILPICSFCKKIRDDQGYWNQVEAYVSKHSDAQFSHAICPECMKKHYPEFIK